MKKFKIKTITSFNSIAGQMILYDGEDVKYATILKNAIVISDNMGNTNLYEWKDIIHSLDLCKIMYLDNGI